MPRWNIERFEGNHVCFEMRGVGLNKLHNVEIVQDDGGELNTEGKEKGGVGGKKGYIYTRSLVQLVGHDSFDSYRAVCW